MAGYAFANPPFELRDTFSKRLISRSRLRRDSRLIQLVGRVVGEAVTRRISVERNTKADYAGACHRAGHFGPDPLG